jgi:predicted DCC family thiol-disulfide oxidoreductase YuxK
MSTKVYYNSACPVCKAGIENQRQHMEKCGVEDIEWIDVHQHPNRVSEVGNPLEQVREQLHIKDNTGQLNIGIDAFIHLWKQVPHQRRLAKLFQFPVIKQIAQLIYKGFAKLLYCWNRALKHW